MASFRIRHNEDPFKNSKTRTAFGLLIKNSQCSIFQLLQIRPPRIDFINRAGTSGLVAIAAANRTQSLTVVPTESFQGKRQDKKLTDIFSKVEHVRIGRKILDLLYIVFIPIGRFLPLHIHNRVLGFDGPFEFIQATIADETP